MKFNRTVAVLGTATLLQIMIGAVSLNAAPDLSQQATNQALSAALDKLSSVHRQVTPNVPSTDQTEKVEAPSQSTAQIQSRESAQPAVAQAERKPAASVDKDEEKVITLDLRSNADKKTQQASSKKPVTQKIKDALKKRAASLKKSGVIRDKSAAGDRSDLLDRRRATIASAAMGFRGTPYVWGGDRPGAFDCSGFTQYLYKKHFGISLPHNASMQYGRGRAVSRGDLTVGDLVFFSNTGGRKGITHVGMYIGNDKFIHAANPKRGVRVDSLFGGYYGKSYAGARRYR